MVLVSSSLWYKVLSIISIVFIFIIIIKCEGSQLFSSPSTEKRALAALGSATLDDSEGRKRWCLASLPVSGRPLTKSLRGRCEEHWGGITYLERKVASASF